MCRRKSVRKHLLAQARLIRETLLLLTTALASQTRLIPTYLIKTLSAMLNAFAALLFLFSVSAQLVVCESSEQMTQFVLHVASIPLCIVDWLAPRLYIGREFVYGTGCITLLFLCHRTLLGLNGEQLIQHLLFRKVRTSLSLQIPFYITSR